MQGHKKQKYDGGAVKHEGLYPKISNKLTGWAIYKGGFGNYFKIRVFKTA
jgi:hypothetical protein